MKQQLQTYSMESLLAFCTLFFCIWFYSPGSWNQSARDDMTYAIVENGTFRIDRFLPYPNRCYNTGDWAKHEGHYYSNKAPGASFVGAIAYFPVYYGEKIFHPERSKSLEIFNAKWITTWNSAIPTAIAVFFMSILLRGLACSRARSLVFAVCFGLGTMMWPYSTMNWGHPLAASFLVFALYCLVRNRPWGAVLCGFWCGCAVLTDYGAVLALPFFGGYLFLRRKSDLFRFMVGGFCPALLFAWYHNHCFGSPFTLASSCSNPTFLETEKMGGLFGGISWLIPLKLLISMHRGLLPISPVLLLAFPGAVQMWQSGKKAMVLLCSGWILTGLLANASFNGWHGGASVGPRYLIYTLPAWIVLTSAFRWKENLGRGIILVLGGFSFLNMTVISVFVPFVHGSFLNPLYGVLWGRLLSGDSFGTFGVGVRLHAMEPDALYWVTMSNISIGRFFDSPLLDFVLILAISLLLLIFFLKQPLFVPYMNSFRQDWEKLQRKNFKLSLSFFGWMTVLGIVLLLIFPEDIKWLNDEPLEIGKAFMCNQHNLFAQEGFCGTTGNTYGAFAIWFYQILLLWTVNPVILGFLKMALVTSGVLFCLWKLAKRAGWSSSVLFVLFLLNPWLWHYSRMISGNVLNLFFIPFCLWMMLDFSRTGKWSRFFWVMVVCTGTVWMHTIAIPLIAVIGLWSLLLLKKHWKQMLSSGIPAGILILWILLDRVQESCQQAGTLGKVSGFGILDSATQFFELASLSGFNREIFYRMLPLPEGTGQLLVISEVITLVISLAFLLIAAVWLFRCRKEPWTDAKRITAFSLAVTGMQFLFFLIVRLDRHPHYGMIAIVPMLLLMAAAVHAGKNSKLIQGLFKVWLFLCAFWILIFTIQIDLFGGTRTPHYGVTLGNQWKLARQIVQHSKEHQVIGIDIHGTLYQIFPHGLSMMLMLAKAERADEKSQKDGILDMISFEYEGSSAFLKLKETLASVSQQSAGVPGTGRPDAVPSVFRPTGQSSGNPPVR